FVGARALVAQLAKLTLKRPSRRRQRIDHFFPGKRPLLMHLVVTDVTAVPLPGKQREIHGAKAPLGIVRALPDVGDVLASVGEGSLPIFPQTVLGVKIKEQKSPRRKRGRRLPQRLFQVPVTREVVEAGNQTDRRMP